MTEFIKIARTEDLLPGQRLWHEFEEETVVVFNVDGDYFCIADRCTHDDGPLEDGQMCGFEVECPRHGALFDIRTGKVVRLPATSPVPTFQVKIEDGDIYVESPDEW